MTLVLFGINLLLIMAMWHFVAKKTVLDHTRDKLFDLRDEIRTEHLAKGFGIQSDAYKNLRDMINAYLRYTEHYSVWEAACVHDELAKNPELGEFIRKKVDSRFVTQDETHAAYIEFVRSRAANILLEFTVYDSGLLMVVAISATPIVLVKSMYSLCGRGLAAVGRVVESDIRFLGKAFGATWRSSAQNVASRLVDRYSFDAAISDDRYRFA